MDNFEFTDEEIESVCLELDIPVTAFSDRGSERRIIIEHWANANIIACPGSGKTTVLLAKLLLLSRRMPFKDGSGICVLTHTNVAIDEIKSKLGSKADILFKHPNFFGTIQSFVDKYLVMPAFSLYPRRELNRISRIDSGYVYYQKKSCFYDIGFGRNGSKTLCNYLYGQANQNAKKGASSRVKTNNAIDFLASLKFDVTDNVIKRSNGKTLIKNPTTENYRAIKDLIFSLWDKGYLSFEDTFNFANWYTTQYGSLINPIFEKRFKFLLVDEMQDTQKHQMSIIDSVFNANVVRQYYGDPDQAIFNDGVDEATAWNLKDEQFLQLEIKDSKRYSSAISECINPFKKELSDVVGKANWTSLQPMILLYDNPEDAIDLFYDEIKKNNLLQEEAFKNWNRESSPFNVVGFIGKKPEQGNDKITIHSYVSNYSRDTAKRNMNFDNLVSYFQKRPLEEVDKTGTRIYYDIFINALIAILALSTDKTHTKTTLVNELKDTHPSFFIEYKVKTFNWIKEIESERKQAKEIKHEFLTLLEKCGYTIPSHQFITEDSVSSQVEFKNNSNVISKDDIYIKIGTIHSVKGETHMATLLLENENNKKFESNYFFNDKSGNLFCGEKYKRPKSFIQLESRLKTTYVAMSRPTHLLCVAMSRDKVGCTTCVGEKKENCKWKVVS